MVFHKNQQNKIFKKSMLALCVALSATSYAQDAADDESTDVEEVVVTGVRANLQNAQDVKRNSDTFVDAISSDDIGSLPDRSVLEAMQRIPGISIERFAAANDPDHFGVEGSGAVVRGMSATRSEFNGRDSFTANSGRGLSFQDVPPELMAGVQVFKNQTADMVEGGIGGTVNLITRKPFDSSGRVLAFNADYSYGDMAEEWTPTVSGLFSDRWETSAGEFGFLVNVSQSNLKGISHGIQADAYVEYRDDYTGFYRNLTGPAGSHAGPNDMAGAEDFVGESVWMPNGSNASMKFDDREREGFASSVQWKNNEDTVEATIQFMRSDALLAWNENALKYQSGYDRRQSIPLNGTEYSFDDDGLFQSGTITQDGRFSDGGWRSADPDGPALHIPHAANWSGTGLAQFGQRFQTDTRYKSTHTVIDDIGFNLKLNPTDRLEIVFDAQHIGADTVDDDVTVMMATHAIQSFDVTGSTPVLTLMEPWQGVRDKNMQLDSNKLPIPGSEGTGSFGVAGAGALYGGKILPGFADDVNGDANWFQDSTSYYWQSVMDHYERSNGASNAGRLDFKYEIEDMPVIKSVWFGYRYANREQTVRNSTYNWGSLAPVWAQPWDQIGFNGNAVVAGLRGKWDSVDWSDFHGGGVINIPGNTTLHPDLKLAREIARDQIELPKASSGTWVNLEDRPGAIPGSPFLPSEVFITEEENSSSYIRVNFGSDDTRFRFDGNFGLRHVELTRTATGSVQFPKIENLHPTPAGVPDPNDFAASVAYVEAQRADILADAVALAGAGYTPPAVSGTPTYEELAALRSYENSTINAYPATASAWKFYTDYLGENANYMSETDLGFGNNAAEFLGAENNYETWLPSLNVKVEFSDDLIYRFGVSKAIAMPDMADVRNTTSLGAQQINIVADATIPGQSYKRSVRVDSWSGGSGNPYLNPMQSIQGDMSLEWYFADVGSLTASIFYKDLSNFFINGSFDREYTNPISNVTQEATVTGTINNGEGKLQGFELAYQQFYDMLPAPFDGLGLQVNYSYIDSESIPNQGDLASTTNANTSTDTGARVDLTGLPLQGQSKETFNIVGMYEKDALSVRLAYNWRSRYLLTTRDVISRYPLWNEDAGFLDGSVFYKLNDNFTTGIQFTNLLNTQTETIMILNNDKLEAGRSWFVNDRRVALILKGQF